MKKIMIAALGLSFLTGSFAFAHQNTSSSTMSSTKKSKKKKKSSTSTMSSTTGAN